MTFVAPLPTSTKKARRAKLGLVTLKAPPLPEPKAAPELPEAEPAEAAGKRAQLGPPARCPFLSSFLVGVSLLMLTPD